MNSKSVAMRFVTLAAAVLSVTALAESFVVASGETRTLDDSTIDLYDSISVESGGVLVLDTSEAPAVAITGDGVIRKANSATWTMRAENSSFTGTWEIIGGLVYNSSFKNPFGKNNVKGGSCGIVVTNGATLAMDGNVAEYDYQRFLIGGSGVDGRGALEFGAAVLNTSGRLLRNVALADDATLSMKGLAIVVDGAFDLAGHTMTVCGGGSLYIMNVDISETGEILVVGVPNDITSLMFRSWSNATIEGRITDTDGMCFTLGGYAKIGTYNRYKGFSRPLRVRGQNNVLAHDEQFPDRLTVNDQSCDHQLWGGSITFLDDDGAPSSLEINTRFALCGFIIPGKISGPGSITLTGDGHTFITNGDNDYTGSTTFNKGVYVLGSSGAIPDLMEDPADVVWMKGRLILSGTDPYRFWRLNAQNQSPNDFTAIVTIDGADVTVTKDGFWGVGVGGYYSRLVVTNSLVRSEDVLQKDTFNKIVSYASMTNSLVVGNGAYGLLEVEADSVISNRLLVGMHGNMVYEGISYGAVRQRGGTVVAASPENSTLKGNSLGVGQTCGGYYELIGGELISHGSFNVGAGGVGTLWMRGGSFVLTNVLGSTVAGCLDIGSFNQGNGSIRVSGGAFQYYGNKEVFVGRGVTSNAVHALTVDGDGAVCDFGQAQFNFGYGNNGGSMLFVNMNGGVLRAGGFSKHGNKNHHLENGMFVNFNGGTFRAASGVNVFGDGLFGVDRILVYSGGATVDTDGHDAWITNPITSPNSKGIASITLDAPITNAMSPIVKIESATGCGASAFAHYDWDTHTVDRIDILSTGDGYEDATVALYFDSAVSRARKIANVEFAENAKGGPFTKKGLGTLTLAATNTWAGATCVRGGTLAARCDWAMPTNTAVVISDGATLDLCGRVHRISSVTYQVGGGAIARSELAEMPHAVTFEIASEDILAGKVIALSDDFDLSKVTLSVDGLFPDEMDKETRYPFVTTSGLFTGSPTVLAPGLPVGYRFAYGPKRISLIPTRGFVVICR